MRPGTQCASLFLVLLVSLSALGTVGAVVSPSSYETIFSDNFARGMSNWKLEHGSWNFGDGGLRGSTDDALGVVSHASSWGDFIVTVRMKSLSNSPDILLVRWADPDNYYRIVLMSDHVEVWLRRNGSDRLIYREQSWSANSYAVWPSIQLNDWHELRVKVQGQAPTITFTLIDIPDVTVITVKDISGDPIPVGGLGLAVASHSSSLFARVDVTTLHPELTGAQRIILLLVEFPDMKHQNTPDQIYQSVLVKLNQYYTEVSYNLTRTVGVVTPGWKTLPHPSTYYNLAIPFTNRPSNGEAFLQDSINAWDPEVNYSQYDYVFICGAGNSVWGEAWYNLHMPTGDGVTIDRLIAQSESPASGLATWEICVHEFQPPIPSPPGSLQ